MIPVGSICVWTVTMQNVMVVQSMRVVCIVQYKINGRSQIAYIDELKPTGSFAPLLLVIHGAARVSNKYKDRIIDDMYVSSSRVRS